MSTPIALAEIEGVARQIAQRFVPDRVILFGSYACGKPHESSDVDLLVVMETDEPPLHTAARIAAGIDHPFPLDIVVWRPSDLEASLKRKGVFATQVASEGVVLYEARDHRVG